MTYTDEEIRHLAISLLKMPTARDGQARIGASNLSNQCDRCLAGNLTGDDRSTPITDAAWMGRVLGTAFHSVLEQRANQALTFDGLEGDALIAARGQARALTGLHPDAVAERHVYFADIAGYGPVGGTIDLDLGDTIVDWKGTTRQKLCILIDYMQTKRGLEPIFGRKHKDVAGSGKGMISEKEYAAEMVKMAYKVDGYFGQASLYMRGAGAKRASLVFLARNGTGVFDNPAGSRYTDPTAVHDVHVLSFDYSPAYAEALIARGQAIWDHLQSGGAPTDFTSHEHCFACSREIEEAAKAALAAPNVDIEVEFTMPAAA